MSNCELDRVNRKLLSCTGNLLDQINCTGIDGEGSIQGFENKKPVSSYLRRVLEFEGAGLGPASPASTPERLAQLFVALCFADTSVGQQARVQASQLVAAGDAALP